jgi:acylaminoacyl-peptidase
MRRVIAAACAVLLLGAGPAAGRPFVAKDLAMLDRVSDPKLSGDGRWIAYTVRTTDWDNNRGLNTLYLRDRLAQSSPIKLTQDEKAPPSARWSASGRLYFLSGKSGLQQLWRREKDGTLVQLTAFPADISSFRVAADEAGAIVAISVRPDCPTLACTKTADDAKAKVKATGQLFADGGQIRFWDAYDDGKRVNLFNVRFGQGAASEAAPLMKGWAADVPDKLAGNDASFALSKDERTIYFASRDPSFAPGWGTPSIIWSVPRDGSSAPRPVIAEAKTSNAQPSLSPDGRTLAFLARKHETTFSRTALMTLDLRTGATREVAPESDWLLRKFRWSDDGKTILASAEARGQGPLYAIDIASGRSRQLVGNANVSDFDAVGRATVYVADSLSGPGQLYDLVDGAPTALTQIGKDLFDAAPMAPVEQFSFAGWNGETVYGYLIRPQGFVEGRKYPVAFVIHGGPHGNSGNSWSYRWNPQLFASMGYATVQIDFHGSTGYGEAFARSIVGHWGDRPLEDLQKGWAHALKQYAWLDGDRACALGGSYGGYMINWIAGNWQGPWKCLVNHDGLFDGRVMAYSTDIPSFSEDQYEGLSARTTDVEGRFDPSDRVDQWKVPMLVVHSGRDYRVPMDQGIATVHALQRMKVPHQMLYFPDENHWVLKPQNSAQWYATVEAWLGRWTGQTAAELARTTPPTTTSH